MAFVVGLVAMAAAVWWLMRLKRRDVDDCRAVLGLPPAPRSTERGTTPEGFAYTQVGVLEGTLLGRPARLLERAIRHPRTSKRRRTGSQMTVLELTLERPVRVPVRIQPSGLLVELEAFTRGAAGDRVPIEPGFDAAYVVYAQRPAEALLLLSPAVRECLLAFRSSVAGNLPPTMAGQLASGLMLGTFSIEGTTASYAAFGSPTRATAEHVAKAAPLLLDLATAAGG